MKRTLLILPAIVFAIVIAVSVMLPTPATLGAVTVVDKSNACKGLERAVENCVARTGSCAECDQLAEQLRKHGCNHLCGQSSSHGGGDSSSGAGN